MRSPTLRATMIAAALLLAGCSLLTRGPFEVTLPARNDLAALPVRLIDEADAITALEVPVVAPDIAGVVGDEFAIAVPGRPNAVFVVWLGGMCDQQVDLTYTGDDATFSVTTLSGFGGCRMAGVFRSVIVVFSSPIDASTVTVEQRR